MKGWRTMVTSVAFASLGAGLLIWGEPQHTDAGMALITAGVAFGQLRMITNGPVGGGGE